MKRKEKKFDISKRTLKISVLSIFLIVLIALISLVIIIKPGKKPINPENFAKISESKVIMGFNKKQFLTENENKVEIDQVNDIILELEQKVNIGRSKEIKKVTIENSKLKKVPELGTVKLLLPKEGKEEVFKSDSENMLGKKITFAPENNKVKMIFRVENSDVFTGKQPKEKEEVDMKVFESRIDKAKFVINFDIVVQLKNNKRFKTNITMDLPKSAEILEKTVEKELELSDKEFIQVK